MYRYDTFMGQIMGHSTMTTTRYVTPFVTLCNKLKWLKNGKKTVKTVQNDTNVTKRYEQVEKQVNGKNSTKQCSSAFDI